jgi:WD40 repeat protein
MNIGSLPGYYWDEDKRKYFKIQASHVAPQGAKHTKESMKTDLRKAKKRKLESKKEAKRYQHTVKRSHVLQNAIIGGTGIHREYGSTEPSSSVDQLDAAILSQFRAKIMEVRLPGFEGCPHIRLTSATYLPATGQMVTASSHSHTGVSALHVCKWDWDAPQFAMPYGCGFAAFHSSITSVSAATNTDMPRVIACSQQDASTGQIFTSPIPPPGSEPTYPYQPPGIYFHVKCGASNRMITSINSITGIAAVSASKYIYVMNDDATMSTSLAHNNDEYRIGLDWLDPNTIAFESNSPAQGDHQIKLWDVRTAKGVVSRFKMRNRITGLLNPSHPESKTVKNSNQLLASTNHRINLYDTRMPRKPDQSHDTPVLSFPHVHQGPELDFTANGHDLIAAVDRDNVVQIFSLRSGRKMSSLILPESTPSARAGVVLKKLQWYDDPVVGSALQACMGNEIVRWSWGGSDSDDEG